MQLALLRSALIYCYGAHAQQGVSNYEQLFCMEANKTDAWRANSTSIRNIRLICGYQLMFYRFLMAPYWVNCQTVGWFPNPADVTQKYAKIGFSRSFQISHFVPRPPFRL